MSDSLPEASSAGPRPSRRSLTDWARQRLYEFVLEGQWAPGQVVQETQLTEQLGVSRSPVRDALAELERDGLLVRADHDGRRHVVVFTEADIEELFDVRAALEGLAARMAAPRMTDRLLERLDALLEEMVTVAPGDEGRGRSFAADFEFHALVVQAAERPRVHAMLRRVWLQTRALLADLNRRSVYPSRPEIGRVTDEHRRMLEALRARDGDATENALQAHLLGAKGRLLKTLREAEAVASLPEPSSGASTGAAGLATEQPLNGSS